LSGVMRTLGVTRKNGGREPIEVDENGFRHFDEAAALEQEAQSTRAPNLLGMLWKVRGEAGGFFTDLAEAIQKDLGVAQAEEAGLV
jgi:hypothetical protein